MAALDEQLLKIVNASGFPLQIGLRRTINQSKIDHGWSVDVEEHHWRHPRSGAEGYIDLVIEHESLFLRLIVECKRPTDAKWIFLTPKGSRPSSQVLSAFAATKGGGGRDLTGWCDLAIEPASPESAFCVLQGQSDRDRPMLERITDSLLPSVEALAFEELAIPGYYCGGLKHIYVPLVVTTATLYTVSFDPAAVDLEVGQLPVSSANFTPVPFARFRKALATSEQLRIRAKIKSSIFLA